MSLPSPGLLLALTKPRLVVMNMVAALSGGVLAGGLSGDGVKLVLSLLAIGLIVAAANAANMALERDLDARMLRTRGRPLPTGQLAPLSAWLFSGLCAVAATALFLLAVNPLTAALGVVGLLTYALLYTPMKQRTPLALPVGALAGALPPLMGWTGITGGLELPGLLLFALFFLWQVPHFLTIAVVRRQEYSAAGYRTAAQTHEAALIGRQVVVTCALLLPVSLSLLPAAGQGWPFALITVSASLGLLLVALGGLRRPQSAAGADRWARRFFRASLAYPPAITAGILLNQLLGA